MDEALLKYELGHTILHGRNPLQGPVTQFDKLGDRPPPAPASNPPQNKLAPIPETPPNKPSILQPKNPKRIDYRRDHSPLIIPPRKELTPEEKRAREEERKRKETEEAKRKKLEAEKKRKAQIKALKEFEEKQRYELEMKRRREEIAKKKAEKKREAEEYMRKKREKEQQKIKMDEEARKKKRQEMLEHMKKNQEAIRLMNLEFDQCIQFLKIDASFIKWGNQCYAGSLKHRLCHTISSLTD